MSESSKKYKVIPKSSFESDDVVKLSKFLLNKYLVSQIDQKLCVSKIVETEAYRAPEDKASHAYKNKKTNRTKTMFEAGGRSYVYLCYGIHNMFNIVTGPSGTAHAILIRALEPIEGINHMQLRRMQKSNNFNLTNGPGKLCKALGITKIHNDINLCDSKSLIYIADNTTVKPANIIASPRVGIAYAEECAYWPWRFRIKNNPWTSLPHKVRLA